MDKHADAPPKDRELNDTIEEPPWYNIPPKVYPIVKDGVFIGLRYENELPSAN